MPYVLKPNKIFVKNPEGSGFLPQNVIADETAQDIIEQIEAAGASTVSTVQQAGTSTITTVQQAIANSQDAVDGIEAQKDTIIASIASIAGQGTDATLTQSGVAADAKAAGDAIGDLKSAIDNTLFNAAGTIVAVKSDGWTQGGMTTAMTGTSDSTNRARIMASKLPVIPEGNIVFVHVPSGYLARVAAYSARSNFSSKIANITDGSDYVSGDIVIPSTYYGNYMGCVVKKDDDSDFSSSDVDALEDAITICITSVVGNLNDLQTTDKSTVVAAVNETYGAATNNEERIERIESITLGEKQNALENEGKGRWTISETSVSYVAGTGSVFALKPVEVVPGDIIKIDFNAASGASVIFANYANNEYTLKSSESPYTSNSAKNNRVTKIYTIQPDVNRVLLNKYGTGVASYCNLIVQKTDKTLTLENVASDSKEVGLKVTAFNNAVFQSVTGEAAFVRAGMIDVYGNTINSNHFNLYKFDVEERTGQEIAISTYKHATTQNNMAMVAFYDVEFSDISSSSILSVATSDHCVKHGELYTVDSGESPAMDINERFTVPRTAKTMIVSHSSDVSGTPEVTYQDSIAGSGGQKLPYQSGKIFFTVDCERPIPFGEGDYAEQTLKTIECVLMLPETYTSGGKPTRLVLACHGSSGFVDATNDLWYPSANTNWKNFMNYLLRAGYAVFDSNIFSWDEEGMTTTKVARADGSPLYIQVLKKAYDYIQEHYNVYPQIFAHGTSMGGVGARAFAHMYPELVLAISSFAGRDVCRYLHELQGDNYVAKESYYKAYGYASANDLKIDRFSHCVGISDSLGIMKTEMTNDGKMVIVYPPNREAGTQENPYSGYEAWVDFFSDLSAQTRQSNLDQWIGHTNVPFKAWNAWQDNEGCTAQEILMAKAFEKTGSAPYYAVSYDLDESEYMDYTVDPPSNEAHTKISYGSIRNMRAQLVEWYKRWE